MVDVATASVISTLAVNGIVCLVLVLLFEIIRGGSLEDVYAPKSKWGASSYKSVVLPKKGPFAWVSQVLFDFSDDEILARVGLDGWVLLRFLRMLAVLSGGVAFLSLTVLAPTYYTKQNFLAIDTTLQNVSTSVVNQTNVTAVTGIDMLTMANVPSESHSLWAPFLCHYLFTFSFFYLLHQEYKRFAQKRKEYLHTGGKTPLVGYSVQMEGLPASARSVDGLKNFVEQIFPSLTAFATPVVSCKSLQKLLGERLKITTQLEKSTGIIEGTGKRPKKGLGFCGSGDKVDAASHWAKELQRVNMAIDSARAGAITCQNGGLSQDAQNSGTAYVTLKNRKAALMMTSVAMLYKQHPAVKAFPAPEPANIVWANAAVPVSAQKTGNAITTTVLTVGLLFWGVVIAFVGAISKLEKLEKWFPFLGDLDTASYSLLQGLLPVIAMIVLFALIPIIITKLSLGVERRKTFTKVQEVLFYWYFLYNLANVFLVVFAGSAFNSLNVMIENPTKIPDLLGAALPSVSTFFLNYVITVLFGGLPMVQLRLGSWIMFLLCRKKHKTATDRTLLAGPCAPATVAYGSYFPAVFYIVLLFVIYWTIAPVLAGACCLFFTASYVVYKYQYLFVIVPEVESGGMFFYPLFSRCFTTMQASTLTLIGLMGAKQAATQAVLLFPLLIITFCAKKYIEAKFSTPSLTLSYDMVLEVDEQQHRQKNVFSKPAYTQPALDKSESSNEAAAPRSFRIDGKPLFTAQGTVDEVYYARQVRAEEEEEVEEGGGGAGGSSSRVPQVLRGAPLAPASAGHSQVEHSQVDVELEKMSVDKYIGSQAATVRKQTEYSV